MGRIFFECVYMYNIYVHIGCRHESWMFYCLTLQQSWKTHTENPFLKGYNPWLLLWSWDIYFRGLGGGVVLQWPCDKWLNYPSYQQTSGILLLTPRCHTYSHSLCYALTKKFRGRCTLSRCSWLFMSHMDWFSDLMISGLQREGIC